MTETRISGGTIAAICLIAGFTVTMAPLLVFFIKKFRKQEGESYQNHRFEYGMGIALASIALAATYIGVSVGMIPWQARFHHWTKVQGTVTNVSSRFLADGKATTQNFVVTINGKPYRIDDTRGALLKPGDQVALWCKPVYQFTGTSGEACNWISLSAEPTN